MIVVALNPFVSIVIVNHNGRQHLKTCLSSVHRTKYRPFETILVDNDSSDGSAEYVKKNFKWVRLIESKENIYPAANNLGVKNSKGRMVVFLNNDTEVDPNWIGELVKAMKDKKVVAATSKVKLYWKRDRINSAGMGMDIFGFAFSRGLVCRGVYEKDEGQYDRQQEVFAAYSAAMMIRKDAFERIGGFNEDFGFHYEEIDLCWRARLAGYRIVYVPTALVFHKTGGAKSEFTSKAKFYIEKNRLRTMLQNYGPLMLLKTLPVYFFLKISETLLCLAHKRFNLAKMIVAAWLDNLVRLPRILRDRKRAQRIRRVEDGEIVKHMERGSVELSLLMKGYGRKVLGD